jgi:hypothetical protein
MGLIYVINVELDCVCQGILFCVERLEEGRTLEFLRDAAAVVQEQSGESLDPCGGTPLAQASGGY